MTRIRPLSSASGLALVIAVAHGLNDSYTAFLHPLLPRLIDKLGLNIAMAATLAMTLSLAASLAQPLLGFLSDRFGRRWFVAAGPLLSGIFLSLIGWAPSFAILLVLLILGGLGSAAFHPPGASLAARASAGRGSGLRLSIFSSGGSLGYAMGPMIAVGVVAWLGLGGLWVAMFPAVVGALILVRVVPAGPSDPAASLPPPPAAVLRLLRGPLGLLFGISALGAFIQRVFLTLEPIIVAAAGGSEARGALFLSVYLAAQAAGGLASGFLTDRMDRRRLLAALTLCAFPTHALAVGMDPAGIGTLLAAAAAGFFGMALVPPVVVMAQEALPEGVGLSSGIVMGLAWAAGSVGVLITGAVGDVVGAYSAALFSMPLILLGTALAAHPSLRPYRLPARAG
jgi:FSR family fosmidomycin resistance protein-like MFS transporter